MSRWRSERGACSVLVIGVVCATVLMTATCIPLYRALVVRQEVAGAAAAAALAGADAASGAVPGEPCARASDLAAANGGALAACTVDGLVVTVAVTASAAGLPVEAWATAGPPSLRTG